MDSEGHLVEVEGVGEEEGEVEEDPEGEWVTDTWTEVDHQYDRDQIGEDQTGILAGQTEEGEMVLMVHKGAILEGIVTVEWIVVHHPDLGIHPCLVEETTPPVLETSVEEVLRTG